jgi:hypothetical protein
LTAEKSRYKRNLSGIEKVNKLHAFDEVAGFYLPNRLDLPLFKSLLAINRTVFKAAAQRMLVILN